MNPPQSIAARSGRNIFELEGKSAILALRAVVFLLVTFFILYGKEGLLASQGSNALRWALMVLGVQLASNAALAFCPESWFRKGLGAGLFFFDIVAVSLALYLTQGFESDLFIVYFLVVFMTAAAKKPSVSFAVAGLACVLYGVLFSKGQPDANLWEPTVLIRFPLLLVVAFFTSAIAHSAEKEKEALKMRMQTYWLRSEKMAALGEIVSGLAHELNNPLASILGMSQIMSGDTAQVDSPKGDGPMIAVPASDVRVIERNAMRCKKIISTLLKFASEEQDAPKAPLSALQPLEEALSLLRYQMQISGVKVVWRLHENQSGLRVLANHSHLQQIFFNLINNAVQAMPNGGTLTLSLSRLEVLNDRNIPCEMAEISVEDTGVGLPEGDPELLFQPFFNVASPQKHPGLGLVVVHSLMLKYNGRVIAERLPQGTRFTVRIPTAGTFSATAESAAGTVLQPIGASMAA